MRDADDNPAGALKSVRDALVNADLPVPGQARNASDVDVKIMIIPSEDSTGCLQTLLWKSINDQDLRDCVDDYLRCADVPSNGNRYVKAKVHAYIATKPKPNLKVGEASRQDTGTSVTLLLTT